MTKKSGWKGEKQRHSLAKKGIKTRGGEHYKVRNARRNKILTSTLKKGYQDPDSLFYRSKMEGRTIILPEDNEIDLSKVPKTIFIDGVEYKVQTGLLGGIHDVGIQTYWKSGAERMAQKIEEFSSVGQKTKIVKIGTEEDTGQDLYVVYISQ